MTYQDRIHRDPQICGGQLVVRGTCVLVRTVLSHLAHGSSSAEIVAEFPSLSEEDVRAVIAFAALSPSQASAVAGYDALIAERSGALWAAETDGEFDAFRRALQQLRAKDIWRLDEQWLDHSPAARGTRDC